MPSILQEPSGRREHGGLRTLVECPSKATVLREGPPQDSGAGATWLTFLRPPHTVSLAGWSGAADHPASGTMPCGTVLDYRSGEQPLRSHAELRLTPLTGVDPVAHIRTAFP
ncbi:hypothetical protein [Streptomyces sp. SCL15-4]|uniref:hypothetical protein n=1 Tax=Streptomyces sp. SCL15-4 TaxID=2967221 RepID=UPI00296706F1|nr:hypothetical protein [Streptomyces sp. SCL15-4]